MLIKKKPRQKAMDESGKERRHFPRVVAPIYYRSPRILTPKRRVSNISLGGIRIYSDELLEEGKRIEIEIFLPSGFSIIAIVRVVWINELPADSEAKYDVGLEFIHLPVGAMNELKGVLGEST